MANLIPHDIRDLFPRPDTLLPENDVLNRTQVAQYLDRTEEIYKLNLISPEMAINDVSTSIQSTDDNISGVAWATLGGIHTFNGNYREAFSAFNIAFDKQLHNDSKAYLYIEISNLMRKLNYHHESISILNEAHSLTQNIKLIYRINTYMGLCYRAVDNNTALNYLSDSENFYRETEDDVRLCTVLRHTGLIYIEENDFKKAEAYINEALAIAVANDLDDHFSSCKNDIGWLYVVQKDYEKAISIYKDLLNRKLSPFSKSLALQNLGYIAYEKHDFKSAIEYHSQSLRITREQDIRDMLFEDYFKLGKSYNHLGEIGLADYFYREGYRELQKEINLGLKLMNYRKLLLDNYVLFLQDNQSNPNVNLNEKIFDFTKDKQFKEIRKFFQKALLSKQLQRYPDTSLLCNQLGFDQRTYFNYQKKLGIKRGYDLYENSNPYFDQYLESLVPFTWKEANGKFENDLYSHLLSHYQFNKKKLAEALGVSYASVVQKTSRVRMES